MKTRSDFVVMVLLVGMVAGCGDGAGEADPGTEASVATSQAAPENTVTGAVDPVATEASVATPETTVTGAVGPAANVLFSGMIETTANLSGSLSFVVTDGGEIEQMDLDAVLTDFDCGGGMTRSSSGAATYFFPDPIKVESGRFSMVRSDFSWNGEFDSPTSAKGTLGIDGGSDCANKPPTVAWTASTGG